MERRAVVIQGVVQGVGFCPFVYTLATRLNLGGFVRNQAGGPDRVSYEGQAAVELECLATDTPPDRAYPFELIETRDDDPSRQSLVIDTRPLIRAVAEDVRAEGEPPRIARRFHSAIVEMIAQVCVRIHRATGLEAVALSGGVFQSALLTHEATARLGDEGFRVYRHERVPPNDGGLSLGQLAIAAASAHQPAGAASATEGGEAHVPWHPR